jgi:hypothetical protein
MRRLKYAALETYKIIKPNVADHKKSSDAAFIIFIYKYYILSAMIAIAYVAGA